MKLHIEKAIYGGAGLARVPADAGPLAGKTVFVDGTLPGETVEARIITDKRSFATGKLERILDASPDRIVPDCVYVPRCGGCQYQHTHADAQVGMKLAILKETLARARLTVPAEIAAVHGPAWEYRNRIRLQILRDGGGLAYREGGSHRLLTVDHCPIAAPVLQQAVAAAARLSCPGEEIEFFTNAEQNQLLVTLWSGSEHSSVRLFAETLREQIPQLTGVGIVTEHGVSCWGERSLTYRTDDRAYQASLGGFFQINRFLLPDLLRLVLHDQNAGRRTGQVAWDLYSGAGLFSAALDFEQVTAVESSDISANDLRQNLPQHQQVVRTGTLEFLRRETTGTRRATPDLIVVDPPRAGLGPQISALLGEVAAREIVYVSCDPATLARDLQSLLQFGYEVSSMHLLDLFPQTFHMETVTSLKRN